MNSIDVWQCADCGDRWESYDNALTCCAPAPQRAFRCGECGADYHDEEEAELCCVAVDEEGITVDGENMPIISAAELEAAGQLRLPLPEVSL